MSYSLLLFVGSLLWVCFAPCVVSLKCGGVFTKPCVGDKDIRYDPDASNLVVDHSPLFHRLVGFQVAEGTIQSVISGVLTPPLPIITYTNISIKGSRFYTHRYGFVPIIGRAFIGDAFAVTTHEHDGTLHSFSMGDGTVNDISTIPDRNFKNYPIDNNTMFTTGFFPETNFAYEWGTCLNEDCSLMRAVSEQFDADENNDYKLDFSVRSFQHKINECMYAG